MTFYGVRYHRKDIIKGFQMGESAKQIADRFHMPKTLVIQVLNKAGISQHQMSLYLLPPLKEVS